MKRILLTSDDGYNSAGTRLLIHCLREHYELFVVGTATQQSAVGGKMSLASGFEWKKTDVDGIPAFCVEGSPVDAIELAATAFTPHHFDLTISGINWGCNLGSAVFSSGTVNAALRALATELSPKALAMSWDLPPKHYIHAHTADQSLDEYLKYPGELICPLLDQIEKEKYWGANLLNINFPNDSTHEVLITQGIANVRAVYDYSAGAYNPEGGHFSYSNTRLYNPDLSDELDATAMTKGIISITPFMYDILDRTSYENHRRHSFTLEK